MSVTTQDIGSATTDQRLFALLSQELKERMSDAGSSPGDEHRAIQQLPEGLRAMAAIYSLDVSIAMDDLVWHFFNHHHRGLADETLSGLRVLEADEAAVIFTEVYEIVSAHWDAIGAHRTGSADTWSDCIKSAGLETAVDPLNRRMWDLCTGLGHYGLMQYWLNFARKYPERVLGTSSHQDLPPIE